ncbi:hypothetical protein RND71_006284 [Anisodus tanguticus]|uniref:EF-hand domain-containing protein n=1 Tax=Anisodus tanguticus TaxID=243964 RepID=A0AAE1VNG8_9SOLA|nr:hypothetical protein RND71_006284 [Anisodus tanguticus]
MLTISILFLAVLFIVGLITTHFKLPTKKIQSWIFSLSIKAQTPTPLIKNSNISQKKDLKKSHNKVELKENIVSEEENGQEKDLKDAFDVFDYDKDGLISEEELSKVLSSLGLNQGNKLDDCKEMIRKVDVDGDGMVNFDEFKKMMRAGGRLIAIS